VAVGAAARRPDRGRARLDAPRGPGRERGRGAARGRLRDRGRARARSARPRAHGGRGRGRERLPSRGAERRPAPHRAGGGEEPARHEAESLKEPRLSDSPFPVLEDERPGFWARLRDYLLGGLLVLGPIALSLFVLWRLFLWMDG